MLSIISGCANIIADGILVGQKIGVSGLSAINLCLPVYIVLCVIGSFFVSGAAISASNEIGKGNTDAAQKYYETGLTACIFFSVLMAIAGIFLTDTIAGLLCSDSEVAPMVKDYAAVTLIGAAPKILIYMPFWFLRLDGKNKTVITMMTVMGAGNIILDIILLFVLDMGVFGAALASVIATAAACILGLASQHMGKSTFRFRLSVPDKPSLLSILKAGTPAAMNNLMQMLRLLFVNSMLMADGGKEAVAVFSVVNGISAFGDAVTSDVPLYIPMLCLSLSIIPALWNCILIGYYNVSGRSALASFIVCLLVFVLTAASLWALSELGIVTWLFLPISELLTILVWLCITRVMVTRGENISRYLLVDTTLDKSGNAINFSVMNDNSEICGACERITDLCGINGMKPKQTMRVSLALEEIMTVITQENPQTDVNFDIRVFAIQEVIGIRIRYNRKDLDPLSYDPDDERYMGVSMIQNLCQQTIYRRVFGLNSLLILI